MTTWYCPLPFRHAYIDSTGVAACCKTPRYQVSLAQWTSNTDLIRLQNQLLQGQQAEVCKSCYDEEKLQGRSLRTDSIRDYNNEIFFDTKIDFIDFRSVNICNFKCRSCNPIFSHGIANEVRTHASLKPFFGDPPTTKTVAVTDDNISWIMQNLHNLKRIMLTGGEPTMIPGIKDLVDSIAKNHPDIMILITSNASFEDSFWFDITEKLSNLHWTVSIDAVGPRAEIVRHGTVWPKIEANVTWLAQHASSLDINSVVSNLTVFGLKPLLEFGRRMQHISRQPTGRHGDLGCRHQFFVCQRPYYLAADNWPNDLKPQVLEYLADCLSLDLDEEQHRMVQGLHQQVNDAVFDAGSWDRSQQYNTITDTIRNERHEILYRGQL